MSDLIGVVIFLVGAVVALYLGIWVCFIGGIVQVVEAIKAVPVEAMGIALGIVRVMSASFVGWLTFIITTAISKAFLN